MKKFLVVGAMLALMGCSAAQQQTAATVGAALVPVAAQAAKATPVLSDIALAGCAAQAASNVAGAVASQQGNVAWAPYFSQASALAGLACSW